MNYEISVIIPVFNVEKYIRKTLDSIVNQTLDINKIEVIIVNDCTPDNSMAIVDEFASIYPSFKIINHETNLKQGQARNTGLKHVSADYVTFIDGDDFIEANYFEEALDKIKKSSCDLLISNWEFFTDKYEPPTIHKPDFKQDKIITDLNEMPDLIFFTSPWNKVYKKDLFKFLNFPTGFYEDNGVSCEVLINASKIYLDSNCYYNYRKHSNSTTQTIEINKAFHLIKSIEELTNLINKYPNYASIINQLIIKFVHDILVWIYYYDWFLDEEIAIIQKLQEVNINISKEELKEYKSFIYSHFHYYEEDILNLNNYSPEDFIAIYKHFKFNSKFSILGNIYIDTGSGFNEQEKIAFNYTPQRINKLSFNLDDFKNIKSIRFDPIEGAFSRVKILNNLPIVSSNCENSLDDEFQEFLTLDPHYLLANNFKNNLEIEFRIYFLSHKEIDILINKKINLINYLHNEEKPKKTLFNFRRH